MTSGWEVRRVVCGEGDPSFQEPGSKICAEMERTLAAEARSMSLPRMGWVTPVTNTFEVGTGLIKVRRKEKLAFKGGKRERGGKTKQTHSQSIWSWYQ